MGIKTHEELKQAVYKAKEGDKNALWDIAIYKLYNFYYGMHVKHGSEEDKQNEILFRQMELGLPDMHKEVENIIDLKLKMIENEGLS